MPLTLHLLAVAVFAMGTSEFMLAGLLPDIAVDLGVPIATAGLLTSAFAVGMVVGAPLMAGLARRWPRRSSLLGFLGLFVAAHALGAVTGDFTVLLTTRVVAAVANAGFLAVALTTAADLVPADRKGRALSVLLAGTTLAIITGVPGGALLGTLLDWRATFWAVAALCLLSALGVARALPPTTLDVAGAVPDTAPGVVGAVSGTTSEAARAVSDAAPGVVGAVSDTAPGVEGVVSDTTSEVAGAVSDAAPGLVGAVPDVVRRTVGAPVPDLRRELGLLRRPRLALILLLGALVNAATFGTFTFLAPIVTDVADLGPLWIPVVLVLFGLGAFTGTTIAGRLADHRPGTVIAVGGPLLLGGWAAFALTASQPPALLLLAFTQGALSFALGGTLIARALYEAADAPTMAGSYATAALNVGAAVGPVLAAAALTTGAAGPGPVWVSGILVAAALLLALLRRRDFERVEGGAR
ncbi:MFS transporter [Actinocorallia libanotica]|uniref:MFS transporter n=1 Tax=Actinocorallia libanotica TaxID=46162 RepID=A0ABP4CCZ8_9ACTN